MSDSENAVVLVNVAASRYAYDKLVTLPSPVPAAKRRAIR
jgi:hypothetical protein